MKFFFSTGNSSTHSQSPGQPLAKHSLITNLRYITKLTNYETLLLRDYCIIEYSVRSNTSSLIYLPVSAKLCTTELYVQ
jgi:hypothetical protein